MAEYETRKFAERKEPYYEGLKEVLSLGYSAEDLIHHFPSFVGHMTLSRFLVLYELYKMTLGVAGHIAEAGVYKGAGTLLFAKLTQIFEGESLTLVHGFDWFEGMDPSAEERDEAGVSSYKEDYLRLMRLIKAQKLDHLVHIHKLDLKEELADFFEKHQSLQFKLVFLDAGQYDVVKSCLINFWPRLTSGGVLVLDQFNHEHAPGEARAIREVLPDAQLRTFPFGWMPTAYVVKP
ncbi:MAG: class I SAM-dependent methyltransferase [Acidobacteria bacterium]|nr:class I SAM-dependent methyltransferase [Acidobacteriota bacterium]